jgi:hypothetical protein
MVQKGRKPVQFLPLPEGITDNTEVYEMRGTGEVFTDYEDYLRRYVIHWSPYMLPSLTQGRYEWLNQVRARALVPTTTH